MIYLLITLAVWLAFPFNAGMWRETQIRKLTLPKRKTTFDVLPFILSFHIDVEGAHTPRKALTNALAQLPPHQLTNLRSAASENVDLSEAMFVEAQTHPELTPLAIALAVSEHSGARIGSVLDNLTQEVMHTRSQRAEVHAELAATKATIGVLVGLPLLGMLMGIVMGVNPIGWLLTNKYGHICLASALVLEVCGLVWVRLLVKRALA